MTVKNIIGHVLFEQCDTKSEKAQICIALTINTLKNGDLWDQEIDIKKLIEYIELHK